MTEPPAETTRVHTRILKCTLEVEHARAYWSRTDGLVAASADVAFQQSWFGARSLTRTAELLGILRARYDAFPAALAALRDWPAMTPEARRLVCHWHVQLADPLYRTFTSGLLVERRESSQATITRDGVAAWVERQAPARWSFATRNQLASKLLTAAHEAGLVATKHDPRPLALPRLDRAALEYLLYLLREVRFAGTLLENPYLASVGLTGPLLDDRLRELPGLRFRRQTTLVEFGWAYPDLASWAAARGPRRAALAVGGTR